MNMNFGTNKTPIEVIKEGAFRRIYFRNIYSGINGKWYRKSWKKVDELKNIDKNSIVQVIMTLASIYIKLDVEHRYNFGKIKTELIL